VERKVFNRTYTEHAARGRFAHSGAVEIGRPAAEKNVAEVWFEAA
jgi:hypothetical protein